MKNTAKNLEISGLVELTSTELQSTSGGWGRWAVYGITWFANALSGNKNPGAAAKSSADGYTQVTGDTW